MNQRCKEEGTDLPQDTTTMEWEGFLHLESAEKFEAAGRKSPAFWKVLDQDKKRTWLAKQDTLF